jgi:hypothetical protein
MHLINIIVLKYFISYDMGLVLFISIHTNFRNVYILTDHLCGLVVRVLGYRSGGPGASGTGSTQPDEYN